MAARKTARKPVARKRTAQKAAAQPKVQNELVVRDGKLIVRPKQEEASDDQSE